MSIDGESQIRKTPVLFWVPSAVRLIVLKSVPQYHIFAQSSQSLSFKKKEFRSLMVWSLFILFFDFMPPSQKVTLGDLSPGRIFVINAEGEIFTDLGNHSIGKFSSDGTFFKEFGRKGDGPGEFRKIGWFAINPTNGNIYVTEIPGGHRWVSVFSPEGTYVGEWYPKIDWVDWAGLSTIYFDVAGCAYIMALKTRWKSTAKYRIGKTHRSILKFSPEGDLIKPIYEFSSDFQVEYPGKGNLTIPFHNYLHFNVGTDFVAVREIKNTHISIYSLDGTPIREVNLPFRKHPVTADDRDAWFKWMKSYPYSRDWDLGFWRTNIPFPEYRPVSGRLLLIDHEGHVWSKSYSGYTGAGPNIWARIEIQSGKTELFSFSPVEDLLSVGESVFVRSNDEDDTRFVFKEDFSALEPEP